MKNSDNITPIMLIMGIIGIIVFFGILIIAEYLK